MTNKTKINEEYTYYLVGHISPTGRVMKDIYAVRDRKELLGVFKIDDILCVTELTAEEAAILNKEKLW